MGRNRLARIGKHIARQLDLDNPDTYGSRAFCSSVWGHGSWSRTETKQSSRGTRRLFRQCKQSGSETVEDYTQRLKALAKSCGFCDEVCLEENLIEQLIEGLRDRSVARQLLAAADLNLDMALEICSGNKEDVDVGNDLNRVPVSESLEESLPEEGEDDLDSLVQLDLNQVENEQEISGETLDSRNLEEEELQDLISNIGSSTQDFLDKDNEAVSIPDPEPLEENHSEAGNDDLEDFVQLELATDDTVQEHNPKQGRLSEDSFWDEDGNVQNSDENDIEEEIDNDCFEAVAAAPDWQDKSAADILAEIDDLEGLVQLELADDTVQKDNKKQELLSEESFRDDEGNVGPTKSGKAYLKQWEDFEKFRNSSGEPTEDDFIRYLNYLRVGKKYQASTMWSSFSRLNKCYQVGNFLTMVHDRICL